MARPIWNGMLSFGLLNIPVQLMPGVRESNVHFRMLDGRDNTPIRYEKVNAETGEQVPWKEVVKAFEYTKGKYVVLEEEDLKSAESKGRETVEIETFVDAGEIDPAYFEKPYVLLPGGRAEKGYVLLRETLKRTGRVGIGRVVIRTREYLAMVMPGGDALLLMLLRFPNEVIPITDYALPSSDLTAYRVAPKEIEMAERVVESMSGPWKPEDFQDEFRERVRAAIDRRVKEKGIVSAPENEEIVPDATTNVVDFMSLLQRSLDVRKSATGRKQDGGAGTAKKAAPRKAPPKKTSARSAPRGKSPPRRKSG